MSHWRNQGGGGEDDEEEDDDEPWKSYPTPHLYPRGDRNQLSPTSRERLDNACRQYDSRLPKRGGDDGSTSLMLLDETSQHAHEFEEDDGYDECLDDSDDDLPPPPPKRLRRVQFNSGEEDAPRASQEAPQPLEDDDDIAVDNSEDAANPVTAAAIFLKQWLQSERTVVEMIRDEFQVDLDQPKQPVDVTTVRTKFQEKLDELFDVEHELMQCEDRAKRKDVMAVFKHAGMRGAGMDENFAKSFDSVRQLMHSMLKMIEHAAIVHSIVGANASAESLGRSNRDLIRDFRSGNDKLTLNTKAIVFFLDLAYSHGYRKLRKEGSKEEYVLFEPRMIEGRRTITYQEKGTIKEWIHRCVRQDHFPDIFAKLCAKAATLPTVQKFLEDTTDERLPNYQVSESSHGFMNGFVLASTNRAYFYEDTPEEVTRYVAAHHHEGSFLRREWFSGRRRLPECFENEDTGKRFWRFNQTHHDGTAQEIELEVPTKGSADSPPPLDIQMPALQQILHYQDFTAEMMIWFYALIGRMLLAVGTLDSFAVIVLLSGATQSGKSTVLEAILDALFPNKQRIAVMSSNKEQVFGLQSSYDKDCVVCDEMEQKPNWSPGDIKSMATGGYMSIARKHRDPVFMRWKACVLLSSNYLVPNWQGNDVYALVRRFAPFPFPHTVANPDNDLKLKLAEEGAALFTTCLRSYHWVLHNYGRSAFNRIGPKACLNRIQEMLVELHPMVAFLNKVELFDFAPEGCNEEERRSYYMPLNDLKTLFDEWYRGTRQRNDTVWKPEFYVTPLVNKRCTLGPAVEHVPYPRGGGGMAIRGQFVYGLDRAAL